MRSFADNEAVHILPSPGLPDGADGWVYVMREEDVGGERVRRYVVCLDDGSGIPNMDRARKTVGVDERWLVRRTMERVDG